MDSLVSTQWLEDALADADLVVLDATLHLPITNRDAQAEFLTGHIASARFLDLASLQDETSEVPAALPRAEQLAQRLSQLGVSPANRIVFYDDSAVKSAARAWFLCRACGLSQVSVLDGGLAKWNAEGRALETGEAIVEAAPSFELAPAKGIRFKADMIANIESRTVQVLDARDNGRFSGAVEDAIHNLPTGHIPGSCNLPFVDLFNADGTMKRGDAVQALLKQSGIDLSKPVTTTCGSGITASVLLLAFELLGHTQTSIYDGSWLEWASDPVTPKATGQGGVHG